MKRSSWAILAILVIVIIIVTKSCGLVTMIFYGQMIKPTETWYFSRGFDKNLDPSTVRNQISDSCNISDRAIRLVRRDNDLITSYWVDLDTNYRQDSNIRLKIRFLSAWLVPELKHDVNFPTMKFSTDKKGNLLIKSEETEHRIFHAGDMMGLHHFDIKSPTFIKSASIQYDWHGHDFQYSWITYEGLKDEFHQLKRYSYEGELIDSFYVTSNTAELSVTDNHFIIWNDWSPDKKCQLYNKGKYYELIVENNPFGGYGEDLQPEYVNPLMQSFSPNGYIDNCLKNINFSNPIHAFDWLRNKNTLQTVNATIKSIGYSSFISNDEFQKKQYGIRGSHFVNYNFGYSLSDITDSLIYYYDDEAAPNYYKEFWSRRANENIAELVYTILNEIKDNYSNKPVQINSSLVNDTLKKLLTLDLQLQNTNNVERENILIEYHKYLKYIGMNQSAYNLIFIDDISQSQNINKEEIYNQYLIEKQPYIIDKKRYFLTPNKPGWIDYE